MEYQRAATEGVGELDSTHFGINRIRGERHDGLQVTTPVGTVIAGGLLGVVTTSIGQIISMFMLQVIAGGLLGVVTTSIDQIIIMVTRQSSGFPCCHPFKK
ncbi:unnamed protein product [Lupinus luteus]|uniref:Uncharacterized protein n=1 Tax=Lupinus luteus TaxID=3873 RepID=A0AAV1W2E6_LUPLU